MDTSLAVLIVEDSESDAKLVTRLLEKAGYRVVSEQVETAEQMRAALNKRIWDVVISDYSLPQFDGRAALELLKKTGQDIPFIIVSGAIGEETAVSLMKAGVHDYVMKDDLMRLAPAVARELKQAEDRRETKLAEQALRESEEKYRVLVKNSPDNIARFDRNYKLLFVNRPVWMGDEKLLLLKEEQFIGKSYRELGLHDELCNYWEHCLQTVFVTGKSFATEYAYETADGVRYFDWRLEPELDHNGQTFTVLAQSRDITERKRADEALRLSELDLKEAQAVARIGNWKWNLKNGDIIWSDEMYRLFGVDKNSYTGKLGDIYEKAIHPDDLHVVLPSNAQAFVEKKPIEYRIILPDQSIRYIWTKAGEIVFDHEGNPIYLTGIAQDITERKLAEDQLKQLSRAVEYSPVSILITDKDGKIEYVNPKFTALNGYALDEVRGKTPRILKSGKTPTQEYAKLWKTILSGKEWRGEFFNRKKNGDLYWEYSSISAITDSKGKVTHFVSVNEDITARKEAEEKIRRLNIGLEQMAMTDYLTSLYNRRYFMKRGAEEFKRVGRHRRSLSLLMIDIDRFKNVNDTYGHEAGDLALQQVSAVLKSSLRETDVLGRLGGEEFAVILPDTSLEEAAMLAERVRRTIEITPFVTSSEPLSKTITITICVGVAAYASGMVDIDDLIRKADAALYHAKRSGRNCIIKYKLTMLDEAPGLSSELDGG